MSEMSTIPFEFEYKDYPLIPIKFYSSKRETPVIDALLDSGGDFIVIPKVIAKYLELELVRAGFVDTGFHCFVHPAFRPEAGQDRYQR